MRKIFVIGLNKTATSTFHQLFVANNLKSQHGGISKPLLKGDLIKWHLKTYDGFADHAYKNNFKKIYIQYPDAIYILNTRPLDKWLISRFKHGIRRKNSYYPCTIKKCKRFINHRKKYYNEILEFFKDKPGKLKVINIEESDWIKKLCIELNFLESNIESLNVHPTDLGKHSSILEIVDKTFNLLNFNESERKRLDI